MVGLPLFGKEGSGTPVFKILVRTVQFIVITVGCEKLKTQIKSPVSVTGYVQEGN